ncbi:sensor histidine kinase [Thiomicrorhabdus indica]|uniref:sensor histidine kinase n=1 Tax=Thiomicrorhabdus indica TaxID=2267253 RepID=UPI00102DF39C|nr:sensor histidine kinase [Thiomicrorhabdus indica]
MKSRFKSLKSQLLVGLVSGIALVFALFWWLSQTALHNLSEKYVLTRLEHDIDLIVDHLIQTSDRITLDQSSLGPIYLAPYSGHYYAIQTPQQTIYSASLNHSDLNLPVLSESKQVFEMKGPVENKLLMLVQHREIFGQPITVYVAENHDPIQEVIVEFDTQYALLTLMAIFSVYLLQAQILRRTFNRLKPLETKLQAFQLGHNVQFDPHDYPIEVRNLVNSLNLALKTSKQQFEQTRARNSDLSHSLKTPLNLIFQLLNSAELQQHPQLKQSIADEAEKILQKIEYELKVERFAQQQSIKEQLPMQSVVENIVQGLQQIHQAKAIEFKINIEPNLKLSIEQEDAYELLGNLLDNACKWCRSEVHLTLSSQQLIIEDNGQAPPAEERQKLGQRGYRLDESQPGHGIGLSIVKRLIEAYGWDWQLSASDQGGLKVVVHFN